MGLKLKFLDLVLEARQSLVSSLLYLVRLIINLLYSYLHGYAYFKYIFCLVRPTGWPAYRWGRLAPHVSLLWSSSVESLLESSRVLPRYLDGGIP